jgi:membrane fusion protein, heavy metal efflux system
MFAEIQIEGAPVLTLACPRSALNRNEGGQTVYVKTDMGYDLRQVTVGRIAGNYAEVISGLSEGENVVSAGSLLLRKDLTPGG